MTQAGKRMSSDNGRPQMPTQDIKRDEMPIVPGIRRDFGSGFVSGETTLRYRAVPTKQANRQLAEPWRILLIPTDTDQPTIALLVWGDARIGRDKSADIDLSPYGGSAKGVSRCHALLRPTRSALFLIDLESTNGTQLNSVPVGPGMALKLKTKDIIAFGDLQFTIDILDRPTTGE